MRIKIIKGQDESPEPPKPPPAPAYERAYNTKRDVIIGKQTPPAPPLPVESKESDAEDYEEVEEPPRLSPANPDFNDDYTPRRTRGRPANKQPENPPIPFEIAYFKEHYGDVFGADSLLGKDVIELNLLFGVFSEVLKLRRAIERQE